MDDDNEEEMMTIRKEDLHYYEGSSSTSSEEGSDDVPHYYKFLERTRQLNFNEGDSVILDNSCSSSCSAKSEAASGEFEKLDDNVILNDIVDDLNREYTDCYDNNGEATGIGIKYE